MATPITNTLVLKLQTALYQGGFMPGVMTQTFDANTITQLEAYWASKGWAPPASVAGALDLLQKSFLTEAGLQDPAFTLAEKQIIAQVYAEKRGLAGVGGWLKKNWLWVAGGVVLLGGAVAGGYYWYTKTHEDKPANGLGCGCGLGHSGRTTMYSFPSGKKRGHYKSGGRFHAH